MRYVKSPGDFTPSLFRALGEIEPEWEKLDGVLVFGTHAFSDFDAKLELIREAREKRIPTFAECGGMQLMAIEYARNVLGWTKATSEEIEPRADLHVVVKMESMRVGIRKHGKRNESYWHRYQVDPLCRQMYDPWFDITRDADGVIATMRLRDHPFFVGTQFHPSYGSTKKYPHPILTEFIDACKKR